MLERDVERRLKDQLKKRIPEAMCLKFTSPGSSGVPDRVILLPDGTTLWVEVKRPGEVPRPLQTAMHERMARAGAVVLVVDSREAVDLLISCCYDWLNGFSYAGPAPRFPDSLMWWKYRQKR